MQLLNTLAICVALLASFTPIAYAAEGDVHRATRVAHAILTQSPFISEVTNVVTWTEGPRISAPTAAPVPLTIASAPAAVALDA